MTENADTDPEAERYEADEALLDPGEVIGAPPARRERLGGAVPIRFAPEAIARIKVAADEDGVTVSTWVREQVHRALEVRDRRRSMIVTERRTRPIGLNQIDGRRRRISA